MEKSLPLVWSLAPCWGAGPSFFAPPHGASATEPAHRRLGSPATNGRGRRVRCPFFLSTIGAILSPTSPKKLTPDVDVPVRLPRAGVNTAPGVGVLSIEEAIALEVMIGVATRTRGADGG